MINQFKKSTKTSSGAIGYTGFFLTIVTLFIWFINPSWLSSLNNRCYDYFLKKYHNTPQSLLPVIVDIDERSLEVYGQWPWPRYRLASLIKNISMSEPAAIGLDILFSEPDRTSPVRLQEALKKEIGIDIQFTGLPERFNDNDKMMADVLEKTISVLGFYCRFDPLYSSPRDIGYLQKIPFKIFNPTKISSESFAFANPTYQKTKEDGTPHPHSTKNNKHLINTINESSLDISKTKIFNATGLIAPIDVLAKSAKNCGFINTLSDPDGILRRTPLIIQHKGDLYPSFSLALLQLIHKQYNLAFKGTPEGQSLVFSNISKKPFLCSQKIEIPLDEFGNIMIHFRGPNRTYPYYSAADILDNRYDADNFKGKIVLVGSSASAIKDIHNTSFDPEYIGVEVHATVIDTLISRDFITIPPWGRTIEGLVILGTAIITAIIMIRCKMGTAIVIISFIAGGIFSGADFCFFRWKTFISPVPSLAVISLSFFALTLIKFVNTERDKAFLKDAFSRFVSKPIVDKVISSPQSLKLQGEDKEVSILFADIRNFTTLSENLAPEQVTQLLQEYFTPMTRVITRNNGTLDKFIGDGIMAFWNAPMDVENHMMWTFQSGVDMLSALGELNGEFVRKYGFEINIGIGLHAGVVRVGNMGTEDLFNYTIIGDDVNVASRLENLSKFYGVRIVISEVMKPHVPSTHQVQELDLVRVRGRQKPLRIFGLYSGMFLNNPEKHLDEYHEALTLYRNKNFKAAHHIFLKFNNKKYDRPLYDIYRKRCEFFIKTPPPDDWDGVFIHESN
ncbi:Adenylate/guanylate cyclase with Chase sensor [Desulfamplus magnetovallimortis]|uniref:Adenylate/guanylate cyclase with Chase sensor n=1 Tax=Desulfamplus magnetovallimortis TaxID=1246637 RepID=A0A1W1H791_9BACT|nr:adenylate/guanylate cyclase domain-containing protein [Desulfamplus magnetovallimortis]SLM28342.1 Adenylate/guanylate cyclase with Chase sensor [Desulfamplus magnetovallimortis]